MKIPIKVEMARREEEGEAKEQNKVNEKISFVKREEKEPNLSTAFSLRVVGEICIRILA